MAEWAGVGLQVGWEKIKGVLQVSWRRAGNGLVVG